MSASGGPCPASKNDGMAPDRGGGEAAEAVTPWFVPSKQPLELLFFHKVFVRLRAFMGLRAGEEATVYGVPLLSFQRAIARLMHLLNEAGQGFDVRIYDINGDGTVGWWEFCLLWNEVRPSVKLSLPERVYLTLESPEMSRVGRILSMLVLATISISAGSFIVSTLPSMQQQPCDQCEPEPLPVFAVIDSICVVLFTIEYVTRLLAAAWMRTELPIVNPEHIINLMCTDEVIRWPTKCQRVLDFMRSPPNIIDLAAILPSYIAWCLPTGGQEHGGGDHGVVVLKFIRLMRVVRAFRLGRRFEAVIIIARAMQRSTRAIWVLVLNLAIGMVIFGATMFFVEQGHYDPRTQQFMRAGSWQLNPETNRYELTQEVSPFMSIPHTFWWALVTATTAGYGDMFPTTVPGKVTAGICMIWSLCVIALPVGVIGSNFENVWQEYDQEKCMEQELRRNEVRMRQSMLGNINPITHSSRLHIEVFHNSRLGTADNDVFLGEAEASLRLDPAEPVVTRLELPLQENLAKSGRRATGKVFLEYAWTPQEALEPGLLLKGRLLLTLLRAEGLPMLDWKEGAPPGRDHQVCCDPYVLLTLYPRSPSLDGVLEPRVEQSSTVMNEPSPAWNESMTFDFLWKQEGVRARTSSARKFVQRMSRGNEVGAWVDNLDAQLIGSLPQVADGLKELCRAVPELSAEISDLRQTTQSILTALGTMEHPPTILPWGVRNGTASALAGTKALVAAEAVGRGVELPEEQPADKRPKECRQLQQSPRLEEEGGVDFCFAVPGMIAEVADTGEGPAGVTRAPRPTCD